MPKAADELRILVVKAVIMPIGTSRRELVMYLKVNDQNKALVILKNSACSVFLWRKLSSYKGT
jgi:hypothetical protein